MKFSKFCLATILILLFCQVFLAQISDPSVVETSDYPKVSAKLMSAEILLTNYQTKINLNDYKDKIVILSFIEVWDAYSLKAVSALNDLYTKNSDKLIVIAVSRENAENERMGFRNYVKAKQLKLQTGWINGAYYKAFSEISEFDAVPQFFLIRGGKLRGVFGGYKQFINKKLIESVEKLLQE